MITYVIIAYDFQSQSEFLKDRSIITNMLAVVGGFTAMVIITVISGVRATQRSSWKQSATEKIDAD